MILADSPIVDQETNHMTSEFSDPPGYTHSVIACGFVDVRMKYLKIMTTLGSCSWINNNFEKIMTIKQFST